MRMSVTRLLSPNPAFLLGREARDGMENSGAGHVTGPLEEPATGDDD